MHNNNKNAFDSETEEEIGALLINRIRDHTFEIFLSKWYTHNHQHQQKNINKQQQKFTQIKVNKINSNWHKTYWINKMFIQGQ